jgi:hypothetical protein
MVSAENISCAAVFFLTQQSFVPSIISPLPNQTIPHPYISHHTPHHTTQPSPTWQPWSLMCGSTAGTWRAGSTDLNSSTHWGSGLKRHCKYVRSPRMLLLSVRVCFSLSSLSLSLSLSLLLPPLFVSISLNYLFFSSYFARRTLSHTHTQSPSLNHCADRGSEFYPDIHGSSWTSGELRVGGGSVAPCHGIQR